MELTTFTVVAHGPFCWLSRSRRRYQVIVATSWPAKCALVKRAK